MRVGAFVCLAGTARGLCATHMGMPELLATGLAAGECAAGARAGVLRTVRAGACAVRL